MFSRTVHKYMRTYIKDLSAKKGEEVTPVKLIQRSKSLESFNSLSKEDKEKVKKVAQEVQKASSHTTRRRSNSLPLPLKSGLTI